jgi:hypothetical protein
VDGGVAATANFFQLDRAVPPSGRAPARRRKLAANDVPTRDAPQGGFHAVDRRLFDVACRLVGLGLAGHEITGTFTA